MIEKLPKYYDDLNNAYKDKSWAYLKQLAHTIKGTAENYGFSELSLCAANSEIQIATQDSELIGQSLKEIAKLMC